MINDSPSAKGANLLEKSEWEEVKQSLIKHYIEP